jgi:hypothetical protein
MIEVAQQTPQAQAPQSALHQQLFAAHCCTSSLHAASINSDSHLYFLLFFTHTQHSRQPPDDWGGHGWGGDHGWNDWGGHGWGGHGWGGGWGWGDGGESLILHQMLYYFKHVLSGTLIH